MTLDLQCPATNIQFTLSITTTWSQQKMVVIENGRYREFVPHHVNILKPIRMKSQTLLIIINIIVKLKKNSK